MCSMRAETTHWLGHQNHPTRWEWKMRENSNVSSHDISSSLSLSLYWIYIYIYYVLNHRSIQVYPQLVFLSISLSDFDSFVPPGAHRSPWRCITSTLPSIRTKRLLGDWDAAGGHACHDKTMTWHDTIREHIVIHTHAYIYVYIYRYEERNALYINIDNWI